MKKEVLGIKIDDVSIDQAVEVVIDWLKKGGKHYIVTPNPEIVVMAQQDQELNRILNQADLAIPDGNGLRIGTDMVCITPGIDLMEELIKASLDYGFTIGLLGGKLGIAKKAAECLLRKYPRLKITFANDGGIINEDGEMIGEDTKYIIPNTDLLFVGFGPPKQEKWIAKNLDKISVRIAMAVGGSLDYLSGTVPRAPKLIRKIGLEWFFRLIREPWRIKRQLALIEYLRLLMLS